MGHWGFWPWFGVIVAVLVIAAIAMNLKDLIRYMRIRSM